LQQNTVTINMLLQFKNSRYLAASPRLWHSMVSTAVCRSLLENITSAGAELVSEAMKMFVLLHSWRCEQGPTSRTRTTFLTATNTTKRTAKIRTQILDKDQGQRKQHYPLGSSAGSVLSILFSQSISVPGCIISSRPNDETCSTIVQS